MADTHRATLEERIAKAEEKQRKLDQTRKANYEKITQLKKQKSEEDRKARNHRLIIAGAEAEKVMGCELVKGEPIDRMVRYIQIGQESEFHTDSAVSSESQLEKIGSRICEYYGSVLSDQQIEAMIKFLGEQDRRGNYFRNAIKIR